MRTRGEATGHGWGGDLGGEGTRVGEWLRDMDGGGAKGHGWGGD